MKKYENGGFTLIELLVVIAIIGLLAGMFMGAFAAVRGSAKKSRARSDIEQIKLAWQEYLSEYHKFNFLGGENGADIEARSMDKDALSILCGYDTTYNSLEIPFLDFSDNENNFKGGKIAYLDPWGKMYRFSLDSSGDNKVTVPGGTINSAVAVWSLGPDMVEGTKDDLVSWQK